MALFRRQQLPPDIDPLIDVNDFAALLGCHPVTVYRNLKHNPKLREIMMKIGGRWRIRLSAANRFVDDHAER